MSANDNDEMTDVDEYLKSNPKFAKCRRGKHDFPDEDEVPLLEAYNDPAATHEKLFVCPRCKAKKRSRFSIVLRRGRVASYVELDPRGDYSEAKGYLAKGVRISRRYAREVQIREDLEGKATSARRTERAARRGAATASTKAKAQRGGRKAAAA
ncbi:hypothetical protein [Amycolatopsis sp. CA-230715]|uniref:hypothetical protein n=1 Tax=Amycolatopsis sp. CA-230715 TaxID=2745196 RepID=UPI001C011E7B|nr:hypothetical protein [Amycolatopsis sp. CA-230715]QWF78664.1 hypothetical protein HUW46_02062 [Amycolatopsis sp. CA-230715]